jgi:hypothetical protein
MAVAAGLALRQGECFGLAVEDIDFLRVVVPVRRQVRNVANRLVFALRKTGKTRDVRLPDRDDLRPARRLGRLGRRPCVADPVDQVACRLTNLLGKPAVLVGLLFVGCQAVAGPVEQRGKGPCLLVGERDLAGHHDSFLLSVDPSLPPPPRPRPQAV